MGDGKWDGTLIDKNGRAVRIQKIPPASRKMRKARPMDSDTFFKRLDRTDGTQVKTV